MKVFFAAWWSAFPIPGLAPENSPLASLEFAETRSPSLARRGLGMAIGDIVEMSWDLTREQVADIDARFAAQGIRTLSQVRAMYSKKIWRIIANGVVRNDDEYHLIRTIADFPELFPEGVTLEKVQGMLDRYAAK